MYFSVKAFNSTVRRFENLDNINELNEFVAEYLERGFTKFVVRSFDQDGARFKSFFVADNDNLTVRRLAKQSL